MSHEPTDVPEPGIEHALTLADAALGAAGHEVTDEETRELGRQIAAGAITGDEAAARLVAKLRSKPSGPIFLTRQRARASHWGSPRAPRSEWMDPMGTNDNTGAGASAKREYDRRRARDEAKIRETWGDGRIGAVAVALSGERQSTAAWKSGAAGEAEVGRALEAIESEHVVVLHDRRIPVPARTSTTSSSPAPASGSSTRSATGTSGPPAGRGRAVPSAHEKLIVGWGPHEARRQRPPPGGARAGRRRSSPVHGALCFVDADWPLFGGSFTVRGCRRVLAEAALKAARRARGKRSTWPRSLLRSPRTSRRPELSRAVRRCAVAATSPVLSLFPNN